MGKDQRPIIIKKVIKKGHAHHGGSWKVAYADFVTAMMAFFMVMWILGMDEETRKSIEGYFAANPVGVVQGFASGVSPVSRGTTPTVARVQPLKFVSRSAEEGEFRTLASKIEARLEGSDGLGSIAAQIEVVVTEEGLRIELIESKDGETFFAFGSAVLEPAAMRALRIIGAQLKESSKSPIVVEGHTDSAPFGSAGYSNWELSSDRAQAARRALASVGISSSRIQHIRGYADQRLREPDKPLSPSNRRTSILLPFSSDMPDIQGGQAAPTPGT
ncbi:MAG: OmpA family protein [Gemmatimonadetes bacterium]|nr:OmpA family protein [Gemmatimonadota bacterium]